MSVLQNAASVLKLYSQDCNALTVTEVARRLDIPKANASRLMKSMRDAGMLDTIGDTLRHRPSTMMLDLAALFRRSTVLVSRAGEAVAAVSGQFGHTGYLSLRDGLEVTAVADYPGTNALRVVSNIGRRLSLDRSATGRTLLARLDDEEVAQLYPDPDRLDALLGRLARIREAGFETSSEEATPGVDAIAIAVGDPATGEVVSLCIVFPHGVVDAEAKKQMIAALGKAAAPIAADLGDSAFVAPDPVI
ncbi:IclR family transcriptional regulator (plasmid) [Sulfitobacter sp. LCG007]